VVEYLRVFHHAGFFCSGSRRMFTMTKDKAMDKSNRTMAQQIAEAAGTFEELRTGHGPKSVTVVLSEDTLVITLHGALTPAEKALAKTPEGASQVQDFHRQLFADSADTMRRPRLRPRRVRSCMFSRLVRWCRCFCSPMEYRQTPGAAMEQSINPEHGAQRC
jgi:Na+-translocating membrane potential-generating system (MpsC)